MAHSIPQLAKFEQSQKRSLPEFRVGQAVRVHYRILEGEKERIQVFQGTVIRKGHTGLGATFCVRKVSFGVGIERIFPLNSPRIEKVETMALGHVRRSRLFYLRDLRGKKSRLRESQSGQGQTPSQAPAAEAASE